MVELKPCPFCGTSLVRYEPRREGDSWYQHPTSDCVLSAVGLGDPFVIFESAGDFAKWNTRAAAGVKGPEAPGCARCMDMGCGACSSLFRNVPAATGTCPNKEACKAMDTCAGLCDPRDTSPTSGVGVLDGEAKPRDTLTQARGSDADM